jgi:hypothetical protein
MNLSHASARDAESKHLSGKPSVVLNISAASV